MRRNSLVQRVLFITAALIAATGLTASNASADTTGTIAGTLTTSAGTGVANAQVALDGDAYRYAYTDANGAYTITGVTPGDYRVRFHPPGRPMQYAYGKTDYSQAAVITVAAGAVLTVNDTLLPVGYIAGRLANRDGSGVWGASVSGYPTSGGGQVGYATTGPDGTYSMAVLPGSYSVGFRLSSGLHQYAYATTNWDEAEIFTIASADQTVTVNDTLIATGSMAGRVVTSTGAPLIDAEVTMQGNSSMRTRTDLSGNYRFGQVAPGDYRVEVRTNAGMQMYAPQTQVWREAQLYPIVADQERTLDITLLPTGTVAGRFTDGGSGLADVSVWISSDFNSASTTTDANGYYRIDDVFGGSYRVHFESWQPRISQWAQGKVSRDTADRFTLTPGTTLTVNDSRLATGSLLVTARDALTGTQIQEFSVSLDPFYGSTTNGVVTISDVPQGTYQASVYAEGYRWLDESVTIDAGRQAELAVTLTPMGRVPVTVVSAATGAPVQGVCAFLQRPQRATVPDGCNHTDEQGRMDLYAEAGSYTIMALPRRGSGYGVQWVGPNGGTGDQREAAVVSVVDGQTSAPVTIRLDRAGSIAGKVTSETGQPVKYGEVGLLTVSASVGGSGWSTTVDKDGNYRLEDLGPYRWPLILNADDHAYQWSGGKTSRFEAQHIQVTSGATATYNHVMKVGTAITGTIRGADGARVNGWLGAFNADTGDYAGQTWAWEDEPFRLLVLAPQQVKVTFYPYWLDGTSFETAGRLPVGATPLSLNLCITAIGTMRLCPMVPPVRPMPSEPGGTLPPQRPLPGVPTPTPTSPAAVMPPIRR